MGPFGQNREGVTMPGKAEYTTGDGVEHHATVRKDDHEDA